MANWREKIELNQALNKASEDFDLSCHEEDCPQKVKELLAAEVKKSEALKIFAPMLLRAKSIAAVNRIIERVFDVADRELVWCGM